MFYCENNSPPPSLLGNIKNRKYWGDEGQRKRHKEEDASNNPFPWDLRNPPFRWTSRYSPFSFWNDGNKWTYPSFKVTGHYLTSATIIQKGNSGSFKYLKHLKIYNLMGIFQEISTILDFIFFISINQSLKYNVSTAGITAFNR